MLKTALLIFFLGITAAQAQTFKFGDVPIEQLQMEVYDKDSTAKGVVIFEKGETLIDYYQNSFHVSYKRHVRIKVLTDEGFDLADVELSFRTSNPEQKIKGIKAVSYTLDENGKVKKESVGRRDRFTEKISDTRSQVKFTIPGIKKGTVLEYSYERTSENPFDFPDWFFQREIPVMWSEYLTQIPEWFNYLTLKKGYQEYHINEQKDYTDRIVFGAGSNTSTLDYKGIEYFFAMKDIPALKAEPFMKVSTDYLAHVRFQLAWHHLPGTFKKNVLLSWADIVTRLLEDEDFGERLVSSPALVNGTSEAIIGAENDLEKMKNIYSYVSTLMDWDESFGKYSFDKLQDVYEEGSGNGASINLILVQMLREAGLDAHPLVVSTRQHGEVITMFPLVNQFNHTIAYVEIDGSYFLLDAKNEKRPFNLLPVSVLNGEGLLIREGGIDWIPLQNYTRNRVTKIVNISIDSTGYTGNMDVQNQGFYALNSRESVDSTEVINSITEYEFEERPGLKIDSVYFTKDVLDEAYNYSIIFSKSDENQSDVVYFNPMITEFYESNPFKLKEREFPVDFDFKFDKVVIMNITVPEGWVVDEMPKSVLHRLPEGAGEFRRILQNADNKITMNFRFKIEKDRFTSDEYEVLKEMYDQMVSSLSQDIVLKRQN